MVGGCAVGAVQEGVELGAGDSDVDVRLEELLVGGVEELGRGVLLSLVVARRHVGDAVGHKMVAHQLVDEVGGVCVAGEGDIAVAGEDLHHFAVQLLACAFAPLLVGSGAEIVRLVAIVDVGFEGAEPTVGIVFVSFLVALHAVEKDFELLLVVAGIGEPTVAEGEDAVKMLFEATDIEAGVVVVAAEREMGTVEVELLVELLEVHGVGSELFEIGNGVVDVGVVEGAVVEVDMDFEDVVVGVGDAVEREVGVDGHDVDVAFEVDFLRFDGVGDVGGNGASKGRGGVFVGGFEMLPVGLDGGLACGEAHLGADKGAVVGVEVFVGHGNDVVACEAHPAVDVFLPFLVVAPFKFELQQEVGDLGYSLDGLLAAGVGGDFDALDEVVAEVALLDAVEAVPHHLLSLDMALEQEVGDIENGVGACILERECHVLGHEETAFGGGFAEKAGVASEDGAEHVESQLVGMVLRHTGENHDAGFDRCLPHIEDFLLVEFGEGIGGLLRHLAGGPDGEFVGHEFLHLGGVEVAHKQEGHVVGHIIGVEEFLHLAGLGILEVLGKADDIAGVGMFAERLGEDVAGKGTHLLVVVHVFLLVDGFELALEEAENGVAETLHIDIHPVGELVGGESVVVDGVVVAGAGIEAGAAHILQDGVHLVGDGILRGGDAETVDFELDVVTLLVVGGGLQTVVGFADAVEIGFLFGPVGGADEVGAFEHDVLKIVGHTCCVGVFVLAACVHHHAAVDLRLAVLFAEDDFETVFEVEGLDWQVDLRRKGERGCKCYAKDKELFHDKNIN